MKVLTPEDRRNVMMDEYISLSSTSSVVAGWVHSSKEVGRKWLGRSAMTAVRSREVPLQSHIKCWHVAGTLQHTQFGFGPISWVSAGRCILALHTGVIIVSVCIRWRATFSQRGNPRGIGWGLCGSRAASLAFLAILSSRLTSKMSKSSSSCSSR